MIEKVVYKNVERYDNMEGLSAVVLDAWGRLTKKLINNSFDQLRMRLEKVVQEGDGHIKHLI